MPNIPTITDQEKDKLIRAIYRGTISVFNLPQNLYMHIASRLDNATLSAFGFEFGDKLPLDTPDFDSIKMLRRNVYEFSAAKEFHQVKDIQNIIFDNKGFQRPLNDVLKDADNIFDQYNRNHLKTEIKTARGQARMAKKWYRATQNKDLFPYMKYVTIGDNKVRDEHSVLDGVVKRVDDPFWQVHMPKNGWNCRCSTIQLRDGDVTPDEDINYAEANVDDMFASNPGVNNEIFDKTKHPYFTDIDKDYKSLASKNFNLPIPKWLNS